MSHTLLHILKQIVEGNTNNEDGRLLLVLDHTFAASSARSSSSLIKHGSGGGSALVQGITQWLRTYTSTTSSLSGMIVWSGDHVSITNISTATDPSVAGALPPLRIIDGSSTRLYVDYDDTQCDADPYCIASSPDSSITVQRLSATQVRDLSFIYRQIESAVSDMIKRMDMQQIPSTSAGDNVAVDHDTGTLVNARGTVVVLIDDLLPLLIRFGSSRVLQFLIALTHPPAARSCGITLIVKVDMEAVNGMQAEQLSFPQSVTSAHSHIGTVSVLSQLKSLATSIIDILNVRRMMQTRGVQADAQTTKQSISGSPSFSSLLSVYFLDVRVFHHRASGKLTSAREELQIARQRHGDHITSWHLTKPTGTNNTSSITSLSTSNVVTPFASSSSSSSSVSSSSLAQQFGSSFSLDLTARAKTARSQIVLPYQHTATQSIHTVADSQHTTAGHFTTDDASLALHEQDEEDDADEDFDDPDDDLDV